MARVLRTESSHLPSRRSARNCAPPSWPGAGLPSLGIGPRHIEILPTPAGKPELRFTGPALERARHLGVRHIHVSITHERTTAAAVVVLEA